MLHDHLKKLNDIIDEEHLVQAEARMCAAVSYEPVDRLPMVAFCNVPGWPTFTYREGFEDMEKMLANELAQVWVGAHVKDDRMFTIRANYGTGIAASLFGSETRLTDDNTMPWSFPISDDALDRILDAGTVDIESSLGGRVFDTERYFLETLSRYDKLARCVKVYCCDTQGPFDVAHLVMGHKIYTEIYDNPARVHRLLDITTDAYIRFTKAQKELSKEYGDYHYHMTHLIRGSIRICDDAGINISAASYREFSKPYNEKVLSELGGGWVHYCGGGHQILPEVLSSKGVTAINFGNPEMQDIDAIYKEAASRGVAVVMWRSDCPVPSGVTTGMTLFAYAPDLDTARKIAAS